MREKNAKVLQIQSARLECFFVTEAPVISINNSLFTNELSLLSVSLPYYYVRQVLGLIEFL